MESTTPSTTQNTTSNIKKMGSRLQDARQGGLNVTEREQSETIGNVMVNAGRTSCPCTSPATSHRGVHLIPSRFLAVRRARHRGTHNERVPVEKGKSDYHMVRWPHKYETHNAHEIVRKLLSTTASRARWTEHDGRIESQKLPVGACNCDSALRTAP
jgi:hypothetical protein